MKKICKCGSEMRMQSQGVWYCYTGDRFVVVTGAETVWYEQERPRIMHNPVTPRAR